MTAIAGMLAGMGGMVVACGLALPAQALQEAVYAGLSGMPAPRLDQSLRTVRRAFGGARWQASRQLAVGAGLGSVALGASAADPFLAAFIMLAARLMLWAQSDALPAMAVTFDWMAEWRGALAALVLVGLDTACGGGVPGLGAAMLGLGVLVALAPGVLAVRDPLVLASAGSASLEVACGALRLGWLAWFGQSVWPHGLLPDWQDVWLAPLRVGVSVLVGAVALGAGHALVFPRFRSKSRVSVVPVSLLLGGLGIMLMLGEAV